MRHSSRFARPIWHSASLLLTAALIAAGASHAVVAQDQTEVARRSSPIGPRLTSTKHPPLPGHPALYWLVPNVAASASPVVARQGAETGASRFARGAALIARGEFARGLPLVKGNVLAAPLANYGQYYEALALIGLNRHADARAPLTQVMARKPEGYLAEAVPVQLAEVAMATGDLDRAVSLLDDLSDEALIAPEDVLLRLAGALERNAKTEKALEMYRRLYYDFPLSAEAADGQSGIERLETTSLVPADRFSRELERAERLFTARRWAQARAALVPLTRAATGTTLQRVTLRIAECDYYLGRASTARAALLPYLDKGPLEAEARFFHLTATRALRDNDTYVALAEKLVADFPDNSWAEETLNNLASYYVTVDDDAAADRAFRELYRRFPKSAYAPRAAWKIGWWTYKNGDVREAADIFENAAAAFPRADYRPSWLYWAGRARDRAGDTVVANARYQLVVADYLNSYYGRLSSKILVSRGQGLTPTLVTADLTSVPSNIFIPSDAVIRQLLTLELYDDAIREVEHAQREWGDSPALQATMAWINHQQGLTLAARERFDRLRGAITQMKRAYPQYLAAGGENLPPDVLHIIFPLDYWSLIKKYADAHGLDPYLMAALIAQESTFTPEIRSSANAVGLMQLLPATGKRYAREIGIRPFSTPSLTQPETNIRLGMAYFKDLVDRFGGTYLALASYNAGESRVARWIAERPGVVQDEFIDDIPFPETQNYVKRILGTAEDYRRLYGSGILTPDASATLRPAAAPRR